MTSIERTGFRISVIPCVNDTNITDTTPDGEICTPQERIANFLDNSFMLVAYVNKYFDQDDFNEPVK